MLETCRRNSSPASPCASAMLVRMQRLSESSASQVLIDSTVNRLLSSRPPRFMGSRAVHSMSGDGRCLRRSPKDFRLILASRRSWSVAVDCHKSIAALLQSSPRPASHEKVEIGLRSRPGRSNLVRKSPRNRCSDHSGRSASCFAQQTDSRQGKVFVFHQTPPEQKVRPGGTYPARCYSPPGS
jgi:hypothetical protein